MRHGEPLGRRTDLATRLLDAGPDGSPGSQLLLGMLALELDGYPGIADGLIGGRFVRAPARTCELALRWILDDSGTMGRGEPVTEALVEILAGVRQQRRIAQLQVEQWTAARPACGTARTAQLPICVREVLDAMVDEVAHLPELRVEAVVIPALAEPCAVVRCTVDAGWHAAAIDAGHCPAALLDACLQPELELIPGDRIMQVVAGS